MANNNSNYFRYLTLKEPRKVAADDTLIFLKRLRLDVSYEFSA